MKKLFTSLLLLSIVVLGSQVFAQEMKQPPRVKARQQFEQRLNLSEKQKEKAKKIHQKGFEEMKPIMTQIGEKRKEIKELKTQAQNDKTSQEKIKQNMEEIKALEQKAHQIRKENSKEFEKILNKKQKQELEKMKSEGRANFHKNHPVKPPFKMFPPVQPPVEKPVEK